MKPTPKQILRLGKENKGMFNNKNRSSFKGEYIKRNEA